MAFRHERTVGGVTSAPNPLLLRDGLGTQPGRYFLAVSVLVNGPAERLRRRWRMTRSRVLLGVPAKTRTRQSVEDASTSRGGDHFAEGRLARYAREHHAGRLAGNQEHPGDAFEHGAGAAGLLFVCSAFRFRTVRGSSVAASGAPAHTLATVAALQRAGGPL